MGQATGNPEWKDYPDESTPVTAQALNNIEDALDGIGGGGATPVNMQYGTWGAASDGIGSRTPSSRFASYWRDGVCIIHIDFKRTSGTESNAIGAVHPSTPVPPGIQEVQVGDYTIYMDPNSNNFGDYDIVSSAPVGTRVIANIIYLY